MDRRAARSGKCLSIETCELGSEGCLLSAGREPVDWLAGIPTGCDDCVFRDCCCPLLEGPDCRCMGLLHEGADAVIWGGL